MMEIEIASYDNLLASITFCNHELLYLVSQPFCLGFTCSDLMMYMYMLHKAKYFD